MASFANSTWGQGWVLLFTSLNVVLASGTFVLGESTREHPISPPMDLYTPKAALHIGLYVAYGGLNGLWNMYALWLLGALSNDPVVLSMYCSFQKFCGALGSVAVTVLDMKKTSFIGMFASYWGLSAGSLLVLVPLILKVEETSIQAQEMELKTVNEADEAN